MTEGETDGNLNLERKRRRQTNRKTGSCKMERRRWMIEKESRCTCRRTVTVVCQNIYDTSSFRGKD